MPGGFDIAIQHICLTPLVEYEEYGRLSATHRFGADTVCRGTALAQLRGWWAFDVAVYVISSGYFLKFDDYNKLYASSWLVSRTVFVGIQPWAGQDRRSVWPFNQSTFRQRDIWAPTSDSSEDTESEAPGHAEDYRRID